MTTKTDELIKEIEAVFEHASTFPHEMHSLMFPKELIQRCLSALKDAEAKIRTFETHVCAGSPIHEIGVTGMYSDRMGNVYKRT